MIARSLKVFWELGHPYGSEIHFLWVYTYGDVFYVNNGVMFITVQVFNGNPLAKCTPLKPCTGSL